MRSEAGSRPERVAFLSRPARPWRTLGELALVSYVSSSAGTGSVVSGGLTWIQLTTKLRLMRYWICDISSSGGESRFEMDLDEPPAEGSVIASGTAGYKVIAVVSLASESSPGVIEVESAQPLVASGSVLTSPDLASGIAAAPDS